MDNNRKYQLPGIILVFLLIVLSVSGQVATDSISNQAGIQLESIEDTNQVFKNAYQMLHRANRESNKAGLFKAYIDIARFHELYGHVDSAIYYFSVLKNLYINDGNSKAIAETCLELKGLYSSKAAYDDCLVQVYEALELYEGLNNQQGIAICYTHICDLLYYEHNYQESSDYCDKAIAIQEQIDNKRDLALSYRYKASSQLFIEGALEVALETINKAIDVYHEMGESGAPLFASLNGRGNILKYLKRYDEAIADYQFIYEKCLELGLTHYVIPPVGNIGHVYVLQEKWEEALPYNLKAIELMIESGNTKNLWENYMLVSDIYKGMGDFENAYEYQILYSKEYQKYLNTIIERLESEAQIKYETAKKDERINEQEVQLEQQRIIQILYISIAVLLLASLIGMLNSRMKIRRKQKQVEESKAELQQSLENLKATQSQLIHAEKMASLGELTAGIAHEIQNPLNFVNNFSDVSVDLIDELNEEMVAGNQTDATDIAGDLKQNLQKIQHHGERASSIVRGMLEHSRAGNNTKEPTDINALADEYLRLAYHGLRAKDKSFNAGFHADLDEQLPNINAVAQEMGRVLLNLINNAFHAVSAKVLANADSDHKPLVIVSTRRVKDSIEISVKDNGSGIPEDIREKIFQPFFTSKPSGEGTGLGLSLSYDIITKGHGGEIKVDSKENEGTEFIIVLPIQ